MLEDQRDERRGLALVLASTTAYGAMPILAKLAYAEGVRPFGLLGYRFAIAVALFALIGGRAPALPWRMRTVLWALGLVFLVNAGAYFKALETTPASIVALVLYTYPMIVAVLSALARIEPLTVRGLAAAGLAVGGCALTLGGPLPARSGPGVWFAFTAAFVYASYLVLGSRFAPGVSAEAAARHVAQVCAAGFVPLAIADGGLAMPVTARAWAAIGTIAVVCTVVALRALMAGLARIGPSRTAVVSALEVPITLGLAAFVLGESMGAQQWAGGGLILSAVLFHNLGPLRRLGPKG